LASISCSDGVRPILLLSPANLESDELGKDVSRYPEILDDSRRRRQRDFIVYEWSGHPKFDRQCA